MSYLDQTRFIQPVKSHKFMYLRNRTRSIAKLTESMANDTIYSTGPINVPNLVLKKYTPYFRTDVNIKYYELISIISEYFQVRTIWVYKTMPNTNIAIKTFWIVGFYEDAFLASKYLANELNNLELIRYNRQEHYRKRRLKSRKKKRIEGLKANKQKASARTKATNVINEILSKLTLLWLEALEKRPFNPHTKEKLSEIDKNINRFIELDYGLKNTVNKPKIDRAFCRKNKYMKNKVIIRYK